MFLVMRQQHKNQKMLVILFYLLCMCSIVSIHARHFTGGTITWAPIDPYDNLTPIDITITQSYTWTYPLIDCSTNVPISTAGRSSQNANLTCMADCTTDGGYSSSVIDILTDCYSASSTLGMLSSRRSKNVSLGLDAHFYLSFVGSAWVSLNDPAQSGLQWSIVTYIDLRRRSDGFINTPPIATVISPQYAIVNQTIEINIPVSDVNTGDDVRCRWSKYIPGYRRRRSSVDDSFFNEYVDQADINHLGLRISSEIRKKRQSCPHGCTNNINCNAPACQGANCTGQKCDDPVCCNLLNATTTAATTTGVTSTTTVETPGTIKSTSSFPHRQAIDECGGICFPDSLPNTTTLSNCTITFIGTKVNTWYGVSIQVEDFIDKNSTTPMSSVPVQLLIYVRGPPICSTPPVIVPLNICSEVQVGATVTFDVYATNLCDPSISVIGDLISTTTVNGMTGSALKNVSMNASLSYVTFTWTAQASQLGSQLICFIAYTTEQVASSQYCITFTVELIANSCIITTTTSTQSTTDTTTTTTTSVTTTTVITSSSITTVGANPNAKVDWPLIVGLSILGLFLALCCSLCCLYWFIWSPQARKRREKHNRTVQDPMRTIAFEREATQNINLPSAKLNRQTPTKDHLIDHVENIHRVTPFDLRIDVLQSPTDLNIRPNSISPMIKLTKIQRGDVDNNDTEENDTKDNSAVVGGTQMPVLKLASMSQAPKPPRVTLEKVPRNQRILNPRARRSSVGNISMINLDRSTMNTPLMANRLPSNQETRKDTVPVKVIKLSRSKSAIQSSDS